MSDFSSGKWGRLAKLSGGIVKAGTSLAKEKLKEKIQNISSSESNTDNTNLSGIKDSIQNTQAQILAAKEIVSTLGELKGAAMKLGQMLTLTDDLLLPKEVTDIFKKLQKDAPRMSAADVDSVFFSNFGKKPEAIFAEFQREAIASASIGQVHIAKLKSGQKVAVKVQYPKIVDAIRSDLEHIDKLDSLMAVLWTNKPQTKALLHELKRSLLAECDYLQEAKSLNLFRENLPENLKDIILIPKTYEEFTTDSILCMEFMEGENFDFAVKQSQEVRDAMAQALYDFHMFSLYSHQRLHTDPQDGNYLLNKNQVVLLDFGSTREFSEDFLIDYVALLIAVERDDLKLYIKSCSQLGFFNEDDPIDLFEKHFKMVKTLYGPYNREGIYGLENTNPFKLIQDFVKDNTLKSLNMKNRSSIKEEFVLLDRANFGIFAKIKKLGAKIDWQKSKKLYRSRLDEKVRQKYSSYFNS